jgi:hypothetical protein
MISGQSIQESTHTVDEPEVSSSTDSHPPELRLLFGDLWKRPVHAPRDRSLVTLAGLLANGQAALMTSPITPADKRPVQP